MNKIFLGCFHSFAGNKDEARKSNVIQTDPNQNHSLPQLTSNHCQFQNGNANSSHSYCTMTPPPQSPAPLALQPSAVVPHPQSSDPILERLQEETPKRIHQILLEKTTNPQMGMYQTGTNKVSSQCLRVGTDPDNSETNRLLINNLTDKATQTLRKEVSLPSNNNNNSPPILPELNTTEGKKRLQSSNSVDNANMNYVFDFTDTNVFQNQDIMGDSRNKSNPFQIPSPDLQVMMNTHSNVMVKRKNSLKLTKSDTSSLKQGKKGRHDSQRKLVTRALQSFAASNRANNNINNSFNKNKGKMNFPDNSLIISNIPAINKQKDLLVLDSEPSDAKVAPVPSDNKVAPMPSDANVAPVPSDANVALVPSDAKVAPVPSDAKVAPKNINQNGLKDNHTVLKEPITEQEKRIEIPSNETEIPYNEYLRENGLQWSSSDSLDMTAPIIQNSQKNENVAQDDSKSQKPSEENSEHSKNQFKVPILNTHVRNLSLDSPLGADISQNGMQPFCIEKSILDWMHKKYCSEQYRKKRSSSADTVNCINGQYFVQLQSKTQPNESGQNEEDVPSFSLHTLQYYKLPKSTVHAGNYQTAPPSFRREFKYRQQRIITNGTLDKNIMVDSDFSRPHILCRPSSAATYFDPDKLPSKK